MPAGLFSFAGATAAIVLSNHSAVNPHPGNQHPILSVRFHIQMEDER
jgi:hypothetical protein